MAKTVAIIQARMDSRRLPGKVLADIYGKPMLARVVERAQRAQLVDEVIVATTDRLADAPIAAWCVESGVPCYRASGDPNDVLARYYEAAKWRQADVIVRITADCPLLDPMVVDMAIITRWGHDADYCSNVDPPTFPDGLDVEAFTFAALEKAHRAATLLSDREHVTPLIRRTAFTHRRIFSRDSALVYERWTVDEAADLEFVRAVYAELGEAPFGMVEVLALLERRPELRQINAGILRNEGYELSLKEDKTHD